MINLAIALGVSILTMLVFSFMLGGGDFNGWYGILPALIALVAVYLVLVRRTLKQVEAVMSRAQVEMTRAQESLMRLGKPPTEKQLKDAIMGSVKIIKEGYKYKRWQFLVESQINAQVGTLLYAVKEFDGAEPYLRNAFLRNWMAQAMLAVTHFRKKKYDEMKATFEAAVKANKKEALLWSIYAWCLWKNSDREGAIAVLNRAKEHCKDERVEENLLNLQNNKKMKMSGWKETWYQFHLAKPPAQKVQQSPFGGRISKKSVYR